MRVLDLFSAAAGGWSLGLHRAGFTTMAACENVEWRRNHDEFGRCKICDAGSAPWDRCDGFKLFKKHEEKPQ